MADTSKEAQCVDMPSNILRALSKRLSEHHREYHTAPILEMSAGAMVRGADTIEALSAERDALSARVAELEAAQPEMVAEVKPLVWIKCDDCTYHDTHCRYEIDIDGGYWRVTRGATGGTRYVCHAKAIADAKASAQADYEQRTLPAITLTPKADAIREGMERAAIAVEAADILEAYEHGHRIHFDDLQEFFADDVRKAAEDV